MKVKEKMEVVRKVEDKKTSIITEYEIGELMHSQEH